MGKRENRIPSMDLDAYGQNTSLIIDFRKGSAEKRKPSRIKGLAKIRSKPSNQSKRTEGNEKTLGRMRGGKGPIKKRRKIGYSGEKKYA